MLERAVKNALAINAGASNPRGIARTLVEMSDGFTSETDPEKRRVWAAAIQVTVNQLLWVTSGMQLDDRVYAEAALVLNAFPSHS